MTPLRNFFVKLIFLGLQHSFGGNLSTLTNPAEFRIAPYNPILTQSLGAGVVPGAKQCGGQGRFIQWRYFGCNSTTVPCRLPADGSTRLEQVDFVPSRYVKELSYRIVMKFDEDESFATPDIVLQNSTVHAGVKYTISTDDRIFSLFKGMNVTVQYVLSRVVDKVEEICAEAKFMLY